MFEVTKARQFHCGLAHMERENHTSYLASHKPEPSGFRPNVLPCIQSIFVPSWHSLMLMSLIGRRKYVVSPLALSHFDA